MEFESLTPEQQEKAKACKTSDELMELAKAEGVELTAEQLEAVSGGDWNCWDVCSKFEDDPTCSIHGFIC